jgi:hypothetical protein
MVVNYHSIAVVTIAAMVMCMTTPVEANCHYRKRREIGRIISVIVGRNIGYISGRIYILYYGNLFDNYSRGFRRNSDNLNSIRALIPWIGGNRRGRSLF